MATIANNLLINAEVISHATIAAGGGTSKTIANVWQFRRTATVNPVVKTQIEAAFQTTYMVPLVALLNAAYVQSGNSVRFLNDATDPPEMVTRAVVGGVAGVRAPTYDAGVFQFRTGYKGKSGRGSKHFSPISESDCIGDVFAGAPLAAWAALSAIFLAGFTDAGGNIWVPSIVSKKPELSQLLKNTTTVFNNDVNSVVMNKTTGTMRRRKVRTVI